MKKKTLNVEKFMTEVQRTCKTAKRLIELIEGNMQNFAEKDPEGAYKQLDTLIALIVLVKRVEEKVLNATKEF